VYSGNGNGAVKKSPRPVVLCIEADTTGMYIRKMVLQEAGYEVLVATDIALAKKLLLSTHIHAVLVDLSTMRASQSLAADLKQLNPRVPLIVLSPYEWLPSDLSKDVDAVHATGATGRAIGQIEASN
jgi:DNA-binding NtrC family response regulator